MIKGRLGGRGNANAVRRNQDAFLAKRQSRLTRRPERPIDQAADSAQTNIYLTIAFLVKNALYDVQSACTQLSAFWHTSSQCQWNVVGGIVSSSAVLGWL
jgi:hypothetical protein